MAGVARKEFGWAKRIGGIRDHVHALLEVRADVPVSHAMNRLKSLSSGFVHKTWRELGHFGWQGGYAAFSVSPSKAGEVIRYIDGQAEHHAHMTFKEELMAFLDRHGVKYDPDHFLD